jgi:hypothetical protein
MRTTKVYSIAIPPDLARQAEALAKKEKLTMSELMQEALRRYRQPPPTFLDMREHIRQIAPAPPAYRAIREDARRKGTDKLTAQQIDREIAAVRRQQAKRNGNRSAQ